MQSRKMVVGLVLLGLAGLAGCAGPTPVQGGDRDPTVEMQGVEFVPKTIEVKVGHNVTWVNKSPLPHDVADSEGNRQSKENMMEGETHTRAFTQVGEWKYYCTIHSGGVGKGGMEGVVIVKA